MAVCLCLFSKNHLVAVGLDIGEESAGCLSRSELIANDAGLLGVVRVPDGILTRE
jgi:hypothetical protein